MEFGIPKEVRDFQSEARVGLTPGGVRSLVRAGHTVYVEKGAGDGAGFLEEEYRNNGANIVYSAAEVYGRSDIVVKVGRPMQQEHRLFRPGQTICSFLHLQSASSDLFEALVEREITAIAYEMIQNKEGAFPVLLPMSEIAGRIAPIIAGQFLMNIYGGRGTLLSGIPGVTRGSVAILGAGVLGSNATRAFLGIGAQVIVLDNNVRKLERIDEVHNGRITTMMATRTNLDRVTKFIDVFVGAIQQPGQRAEQLVSREMVRGMRPGSVIIDYSIDDGGCVETSRPTTLIDPVYVAEKVTHYCVPNTPAAVARTTSYGLTNAVLPYLKDIGKKGIIGMLEQEPGFANGINLYQGNLSHPHVASALDRELTAKISIKR
ncbi:MAG: alanine dehydrogenase [Candidatus Promineifilaceae bacterium]|nr:alanine dehydrogenase [Candidatus Promineifilaceae bacterium]